jgi:hypothetical protein
MKYILILMLLFCCCGANWCHKPSQQYQVIPQPVVVYSGHATYYGYYSHYYIPVVTQNIRYVPYIENRIDYRQVINYNAYPTVPIEQYNYIYPYPYGYNY